MANIRGTLPLPEQNTEISVKTLHYILRIQSLLGQVLQMVPYSLKLSRNRD